MEEKQVGGKGAAITPFQNNLDLKGSFSYSERSAFLYKKTEKLVVAVGMVAGLIKDNQPLSDALRAKSLALLSTVSESLLAKVAISLEERHRSMIHSLALIVELVSLCEVGHYTKHLSEMNSTLLKREFNTLHNSFFEEMAGMSDPHSYLTRDFFVEVEPAISKGHDKGQNVSFIKTVPKHSQKPAQSAQYSQIRGGDGVGSASYGARADRRTLILKTIKEVGEVGVGDLSGSIKGVGEKTIQRELLAMVAEGLLRKQGERRWSRYSIV